MDLFDAEIMAKELISKYVPHYRFAFNNLKTVNGQCNYTTRTINLSRPLTKLRSREAVQNTIMHEIAHALTQGSKHGHAWQMQMLRFGLKPERCSSDKVDKSSISNWKAVCRFCRKESFFVRKPRVVRSCGDCGNKKFNEKYLLTYYPI